MIVYDTTEPTEIRHIIYVRRYHKGRLMADDAAELDDLRRALEAMSEQDRREVIPGLMAVQDHRDDLLGEVAELHGKLNDANENARRAERLAETRLEHATEDFRRAAELAVKLDVAKQDLRRAEQLTRDVMRERDALRCRLGESDGRVSELADERDREVERLQLQLSRAKNEAGLLRYRIEALKASRGMVETERDQLQRAIESWKAEEKLWRGFESEHIADRKRLRAALVRITKSPDAPAVNLRSWARRALKGGE